MIKKDEVPSCLQDPASSFEARARSTRKRLVLVEIEGIRTNAGYLFVANVQHEIVKGKASVLQVLQRIADAYQPR